MEYPVGDDHRLGEQGGVGARVAAVIVTYNSADVLADCLRSLAFSASGVNLTHVVVVDNGSGDESVAIAGATTSLPIHIRPLGGNVGYAAGINAGLAVLDLSTLDAVLILNPDCRLRPGSLAALQRALRQPSRGIAVPRLVSPDGSLHYSLRRRPAVRRALAEALIGGRLAGRIGTLGEVITDPRAYQHSREADWATGAAMLISTLALRELGPWDESFFLYSEETEFALRAQQHDLTLWYEPGAVIEHIGGESATNPALAALLTVNKMRLFRRMHGRFAAGFYFVAVLTGEVLRAVAGRATSRASVVALLMPASRRHLLDCLGARRLCHADGIARHNA